MNLDSRISQISGLKLYRLPKAFNYFYFSLNVLPAAIFWTLSILSLSYFDDEELAYNKARL